MLSIIINNYNYAQFLSAAIDSALAQTYPNTEVLVIDDGSKDDSREVIERYGAQITAVLKENGGQASAMNVGFARSRGDIIIFLDADDVLLPHVGKSVVAAFCEEPGAGKVQYPMNIIDAQGRPTGAVKPTWDVPRPTGDLRQYELCSPFDLLWMSTSGNAFSRTVLESMLPIPENAYASCGADWYLAHVSPFFGPVEFLDEIGASYRIHGANQYTSEALNVSQVRQSIVFMQSTLGFIAQTARRTGLCPPKQIVSFAYVADRMISLKLEPERHPLAEDTRWRLVCLGSVALARRFDVAVAHKFVMLAWLVALAVAPAAIARRLADQMLFPEHRPRWMNALLTWSRPRAIGRIPGRRSRSHALVQSGRTARNIDTSS